MLPWEEKLHCRWSRSHRPPVECVDHGERVKGKARRLGVSFKLFDVAPPKPDGTPQLLSVKYRDNADLARIDEAARMWAERGHGRVAVLDRESGRFLGRSGLQYWPGHDEVEVTWALRRDAWGRGLATEAGRAWLRWGLEHLAVPYITANIAPENTASRSVAERLGMTVLRTDVQHDRDVLVYAAGPGVGTGREGVGG